MSEMTRIVVDRCPPVMNRIPSARRWRGLLTCLLIAAAMIAVPAARAAVTFPMYVSSLPQSIVQVNSAGVVSPFATLPVDSNPYGLASDASGNLYAADNGTDQISKIIPGGVVSLFAILPAGSSPGGLAFDGSGNLYAADYYTFQISKITSGGVVSLFATLPSASYPFGLAFDGGGNLYAADFSSGQISKISPDGLTVSTFATGIAQPRFIAFAPVPEPSSAVLLAVGSLALLRRTRRWRSVAYKT